MKVEPNRAYKILQRLTDATIPKEYRQTVREWLINDRDSALKEEAISQLWAETPDKQTGSTDDSLKITWRKIRFAEKQSAHRFYINKLLRYAAILLLPLISGLVVWQFAHKEYVAPEMIECHVPHGEQRTLLLPDGSLIHLNAGSLLIYPSQFTAGKRQVYLSGEANFLVESDPDKPFIVRTGLLKVEVLGTKFNIESYPGSGMIATTLEDGALKVYKETKPEEPILMKPNEQVRYLFDEDRFTKSTVASFDYAAWTHGELRFINKSLVEILFALERRYNVRFLVDTSIKGTDLYTMKFKAHETIEDALYILGEIIETITYEREGQTIRLDVKSKEVTR